jgi:hypothetical protein
MARMIRLPQSSDTPASTVTSERLTYTWAYRRAPDSQIGEDYLEVREDGRRLAFALCDGVSQSFFGDLAARMVGSAVVEWLWSASFDAMALEDRLRDLCEPATEAVQDVQLPRELSPFVRDVLERKRAHGSESMFVAGAIDTNSVVLVWAGDSRALVRRRNGEALRIPLDARNRWSSTRGMVGELRIERLPAADVRRLVAYTDGLTAFDECDPPPDLDAAIEHATQQSGDDGCYFSVDLH